MKIDFLKQDFSPPADGRVKRSWGAGSRDAEKTAIRYLKKCLGLATFHEYLLAKLRKTGFHLLTFYVIYVKLVSTQLKKAAYINIQEGGRNDQSRIN
jgi:hypothetical protein